MIEFYFLINNFFCHYDDDIKHLLININGFVMFVYGRKCCQASQK